MATDAEAPKTYIDAQVAETRAEDEQSQLKPLTTTQVDEEQDPVMSKPPTPLPTLAPAPSLLTRLANSWLWEVLGLFLSAAALTGIVALLLVYDGKERPDWNPITLNAVLSLLSTTTGLGVGLAATNSISQLKWTWFTQAPRPLTDFQAFDRASRGIFGALKLPFKLHFRDILATFGAATVVLALGFDFFTQNLVQYHNGLVADSSQVALTSRCSMYTAKGPNRDYSTFEADPVLRSNLFNSIVNGKQRDRWATPQFQCSSGNCTWSPITTLGFCAECSDITRDLRRRCDKDGVQCNISLPKSGLNLNYTTDNYTVSGSSLTVGWTYDMQVNNSHPNYYAHQSIRALIDPYKFAKGGQQLWSVETPFSASECVLLPCIQRLQPRVNQGIYEEELLDKWLEDKGNITSMTPPWSTENETETGERFGFDFEAHKGLQTNYLMNRFIRGIVYTNQESIIFEETKDLDLLEAVLYGFPNSTSCDTSRDTFICAMENAAAAITKSICDAPFLANGTDDDATNMAVGEMLVSKTFVRVEFRWLTLPIAVWVLSAVAWLGTVWKTGRLGAPWWKDDPLPLLVIWDDIKDDGMQAKTKPEIESLVGARKVKLDFRER